MPRISEHAPDERSLLDSGLAARLVNVSAAALTADITPERAGPLTEAFVMAELRKQLT